MSLYATVADCRVAMKADNTLADSELLRLLRVVSRRVDMEFQQQTPLFVPYIETRKVMPSSRNVSARYNTLKLPGILLSLTSVTAGSTSLTAGTEVVGFPDSSVPPWNKLRRASTTYDWWYYTPSDGSLYFVAVTGIWGLHYDYANAWLAVDTLAANINSSVTSLTVADVDGVDSLGYTSRISPGALLKIGSEYMEVTAINTGTNVVTVRRAVNGSTAAAHVATDAVYRWQVDDALRWEVARQVGLMYSRRGAYTTVEIAATGTEVRYPHDLLMELRATLQGYAYGV